MKRVAAIAIINDHHMLMGRRRESGKFTNPGGHLNEGEDPLKGAVREVQEETGLNLDPHLFKHLETRIVKKPDGEKIEVHGYRVDLRNKPSTSMKQDPDNEVHRWRWIKLDTDLDHIKDNLHVPLGDNVLLDNILEDKPMRRHARRFWESAKKVGIGEDLKDKILKEGPQQYLQRKKDNEKKAAELIPGGKADGKPDSDFPQDQLLMGRKVEREHTKDPAKANEIVKDHLTEDKKYYTHLKEMEDKYVEKKAFWDGFYKQAGFAGDVGKFYKNMANAAEHLNNLAAEARKTNETISAAIPGLGKKVDEGLKYLKKGVIGTVGIYGGSKAMKLPSEYQQYQYHKANQQLAHQRLKEKKKEMRDASKA